VSSRLQPSDSGLSDDSTRQVQSALSRAFAENILTLAAIVERGRSLANQPKTKEGEAEVMRIVEEALRVTETVAELTHWIYPPRQPVSQTEAWNKVQALAKASADPVVTPDGNDRS
jgi:hypothetical protein